MKFSDINLEDILNDKEVEEDFLEVPLADRVFKGFSIVVIAVLVVALVQFVLVGVIKHQFYSRRALANVSDVKVNPAPRGIITDRFGDSLVANEPSFNIFLNPQSLPQDSGERIKAIDVISKILGLDRASLDQKIARKDWNLNNRLFLASSVSHDQLVSLYSDNIPGVQIESSFERVPVDSLAFSHILGFVGLASEEDLKADFELTPDDLIGRSGLEAYYDDYLRGLNGKEIFYRDAKGKVKESKETQPAKAGNSLETFIDKDLERVFYDSLKGALSKLGRRAGAGLAVNPQNGEVLALVSIPSFDSSRLADFLNDKEKPFFNRIVSGVYNPGSTIKPLVATAALKEGIITPDKQIFSAGYIDLPNPYDPEHPTRFLDWKPQGWVDIYSAIARSSDVYFYNVGGGFKDQKGLGITKLKEWWQKFNLEEKTGIDLPGEKTGFLPDPQWKEKTQNRIWRLGDTYNVSIGQGDLSITPLELLNYINAIANGGKFYKLRVMKDIKNESGKIIAQSQPEIMKEISGDIQSVVPVIQKAMRETVTEPYGTAYMLHDLPITAAAKTGSAQIENNTKINAFVVGYAPYENPQIALLVLVENAQEGSLNAVPVARDVLLWYYNNRILKQKNGN